MKSETTSPLNFQAFQILGGADRITAIQQTSFTTLIPDVIEQSTLGSEATKRSVRDRVLDFYNVYGWMGFVRRPYHQISHASSGRVVLVCDDLYRGNQDFFRDLIASLSNVPSMFVLVVCARETQADLEAFEVGFDEVIAYSDLNELPQKSTRHYGVVSRNRASYAILRNGFIAFLIWIVTPFLFGYVSQAGRDFRVNGQLNRSVRGEIVVSRLVGHASIGELIISSDSDEGIVEVHANGGGWAMHGLPQFLYVSSGTTSRKFEVTRIENKPPTICLVLADGSVVPVAIPLGDPVEPVILPSSVQSRLKSSKTAR